MYLAPLMVFSGSRRESRSDRKFQKMVYADMGLITEKTLPFFFHIFP